MEYDSTSNEKQSRFSGNSKQAPRPSGDNTFAGLRSTSATPSHSSALTSSSSGSDIVHAHTSAAPPTDLGPNTQVETEVDVNHLTAQGSI